MNPKVYLAGPDVFFPDPEEWIARKKTLCAQYGLTGISPLDPLPEEPAAWAAHPLWRRIALRNEAHIRSCQAVIANLTPFRGPSADPGTVYEIGFAHALGLMVFGYATTETPFLPRTLAFLNGTARERPDGAWHDADGLLIEQFGLFDNLMIEGGIAESGGVLITGKAASPHDLSVFEQCAAVAAAALRP